MSKKTEPSSFFLSFIGEFCQIITDVNFNKTAESGLPLVIEGFVLDADDDYIYLSFDGVEITQAINRKNAVYVQSLEQTDEMEKILDTLPSGTKKRDMN
jgi:hypothetical protein